MIELSNGSKVYIHTEDDRTAIIFWYLKIIKDFENKINHQEISLFNLNIDKSLLENWPPDYKEQRIVRLAQLQRAEINCYSNIAQCKATIENCHKDIELIKNA